MAWIRNYIHSFIWDVITHRCLNFDGVFTKPPLKHVACTLLHSLLVWLYPYPALDRGQWCVKKKYIWSLWVNESYESIYNNYIAEWNKAYGVGYSEITLRDTCMGINVYPVFFLMWYQCNKQKICPVVLVITHPRLNFRCGLAIHTKIQIKPS